MRYATEDVSKCSLAGSEAKYPVLYNEIWRAIYSTTGVDNLPEEPNPNLSLSVGNWPRYRC